MKAAVIYEKGGVPVYTDVDEPAPKNNNEILVTVKAVAIKHLDKSRAAGKHYSATISGNEGRIIGGDGVCLLPDGSRVYALGVGGMLAEKAIIERDRMVPVPDDLDDAAAAALPNAVIGSAMALKFKAVIGPGDVVLINGATGFTGRVAVQLAKHYGAAKVIATGRNFSSLNQLLSLGADEIIQITNDEENFHQEIAAAHAVTPLNIIIDYLWGRSAELILSCLKGNGSFTQPARYVSVGGFTGDEIKLSSSTLRSTNLQLSGSGLGAWTKPQVTQLFSEILPEIFQLTAAGKINIETIKANLTDIADLWQMEVPGGRRLVVTL